MARPAVSSVRPSGVVLYTLSLSPIAAKLLLLSNLVCDACNMVGGVPAFGVLQSPPGYLLLLALRSLMNCSNPTNNKRSGRFPFPDTRVLFFPSPVSTESGGGAGGAWKAES